MLKHFDFSNIIQANNDIQTFVILRVSQNINKIVLVENYIGLRKTIIHGVEKPIDVFCCCARKVLIFIFLFKTGSKSWNIIHIMLLRPFRPTIVQRNVSWLGWIVGAILSYSKRKHMISYSKVCLYCFRATYDRFLILRFWSSHDNSMMPALIRYNILNSGDNVLHKDYARKLLFYVFFQEIESFNYRRNQRIFRIICESINKFRIDFFFPLL